MPHKYHSFQYKLSFGLCALLFLLSAGFAHASRTITLAWDRSTDPDVAGYNLFYGTSPGNYTQAVDAGNSPSASLSNLTEGVTYFVVVTAYNSLSLQSLPSNEVSFVVPRNVPPTVSLTTPQAGASLNGVTPIALSANATDPDGSIAKVEFYAGSNKIGQANASPFTAMWSNAASGNYLLTALAYDDSGAAVRSNGVSVTVAGSGSPSPSPSPGTTPEPRVLVVAQTHRVRAGGTAIFKIAASKINFSQPMVVNYSMGGTATAGVNYAQNGVTGQVTIPAGSRSATLVLNTLASATTETMTATVALQPGANYRPSPHIATIVIRP